MSNVSIRSNGRKAFIYIGIILFVVVLNVFSNRKYILSGLLFNEPKAITIDDKKDIPLIEPEFYKKRVFVRSGYTIDTLLIKEDIPQKEIVASSKSLREVFNPRDLKAGTAVTIYYDWNERSEFFGYEFNLSYDKSVLVKKITEGIFKSQQINKIYDTKVNRKSGKIVDSLYQSAQSQGVSPNTIMNLIQLYSFDVDFQRDVHKGTIFEIIYEDYIDEFGEVVKNGNILAAVLKFHDRRVPIYRYTATDGKTDYFNEEGKSARKSLLKTPINGAYISSGFGMRRHPISGYTAFHRGMDFAAKSGTPIYASGDGVISKAIKSTKGYGIHIVIKHPNGYETLYAHMTSHARGMYKGKRVTQGQVIGYVGSTGMSTGPHLHYETRYNGKFVNPNSIKIPPGRTLEGDELVRFKDSISEVKLMD